MENEKRTVPISIVTAVYNGEKYLAETVESVLCQTTSIVTEIVLQQVVEA